MSKKVDAPMPLNLVGRVSSWRERRGKDAGIADYGVESTGGSSIDPLGGEFADRMEGGEVACFSIDERIVRPSPQVLHILNCKRIRVVPHE